MPHVVFGSTGNTGSVVLETLLARGKPVRAVVRDAKKADALRARGAEVVVASLETGEGLADALRGADGVYALVPPDLSSADPLGRARRVVDNLASAVEGSGARQLVFLSSIGAQHAEGTGPIRTLHAAESRLRTLSIPSTFVRAAYFLENWGSVAAAAKGGKLPTFVRPDHVMPMVATRDIGRVAARALAEGPPASRLDVIELSGPRDWSPNDVAAAFGTVLGRAVEAEAAPLEAVVPAFTSFGFSTEGATIYQEMYAGIANGKVAWEGKGARAVRGSVDVETVAAALTT